MDIETYNAILEKRGEDPHEISDGTAKGDERGHLAFRNDLIQNKVVWYNDPTSDWHAFIKNYHPLYSICSAPPQHPFSRKERVAVFIAHIMFAAMLALFVATVLHKAEERMMEEEGSIDRVIIFVSNVMLSVPCGFLKAVSNGILKYMMICPCCERTSCPTCCRRFWGCIGHSILCMWSCIVVLMLIVMVALTVQLGIIREFCVSFLITNVSGWIFSFLLLSCCFRFKWKREKRNGKISEKFKVTYLDYEKHQQDRRLDLEQHANVPSVEGQSMG